MKISDYGIDELFDKDLLFLVPFYSFNCEKDMRAGEEDDEALDRLLGLFRDICRRIDGLLDEGRIDSYVRNLLEETSFRVASKLAENYKKTQKGIMETMGGYVVDILPDKYIRQGFELGRSEGLELGRSEGLELGRSEGLELGRSEGLELGRSEGLELGRSEGLELGRSEGLELGRSEGLELGRSEGLKLGRSEGLELGRSEGLELGLAQGLVQGKKQTIFKFVQDGYIPLELAAREVGMTPEKLQAAMREAGYSLP